MSEVRTRKRKQPVHGQMMDKKTVAKAAHVSTKKLIYFMANHRCTLEEAYDHFKETEPERTLQAVEEMLAILNPA